MRSSAILLAVLALASLALMPLARADNIVTIATGTTIVLPDGFANLTFAQTMQFGQVSFPDGHSVTFDGVTFSVQKSPTAFPSILLNFNIWNPGAGTGTAIRWTPTLATGTAVWFNITGLTSGSYSVNLGGQQVQPASAGPSLSISWQSFPAVLDFIVFVAPNFLNSVGRVNVGCAQNWIPFAVSFACSGVPDLPSANPAFFSWFLNGRPIGTGSSFSVLVPVAGFNMTGRLQIVYTVTNQIVYDGPVTLDARPNAALYLLFLVGFLVWVTIHRRSKLPKPTIRTRVVHPATDFIPGSFQRVRIGDATVIRGRLVGNGELANHKVIEVIRRRP